MDVYSANASRDAAAKEMFLIERHHLGIPGARCCECESAHQMTASALMSEASRMKDGTEDDFDIAQRIDNIDFDISQRELQQNVRKIRKGIMSLLGINNCTNEACSVDKLQSIDLSEETDYTWIYWIIGGLAIAYISTKT